MPTFEGWHTDDDGSPRNGKSVFYRAASDAEPNPNPIEAPTAVTDTSGHWTLTTPAGEWDIYLLDGPTVRMWKARTSLPLSFADGQVAVDANILLTKLDEGVLSDAGPADGTATNLQERLSDIVAQLKALCGGANWFSAPLAGVASIWPKFHATTGHKHTGALDDAPIIPASSVLAGTANDALTPDNIATNLDDRLSDVVSQIRRMTGNVNWYSLPITNLYLASQHIANADHVHGLPLSVSPLGIGGSGQYVKFGTATTGGESTTPTIPVYYIASVPVTFPTPFPTVCDGVWVNAQWWSATAAGAGATAAGFTAYLATQIAGQAGGQPVNWIALGH